ncbi:hypothetical protein BD779DRAFT_109681 [Infundibulicybe gibba]|nr:hypothetical protein BD779DRAFT_109681 [Infundibulicybe gibba]
MDSGRKCHQVPNTLVVGTCSKKTPRSNQTSAISPSPAFAANTYPIPVPPTSIQITTPIEGGAAGRRSDLIECPDCSKEMTEAALPRHRADSCPSNAWKRRYRCVLVGCDKSYTRSDALTRHLKKGKCPGRSLQRLGASTRSTSSSSSGYGGDPHTRFSVLPWTPHTPNSSGSLSSPILSAPEAVPILPISANSIASHGHTQPQLQPALSPHNPVFLVAGGYYRYRSLAPRFLTNTHLSHLPPTMRCWLLTRDVTSVHDLSIWFLQPLLRISCHFSVGANPIPWPRYLNPGVNRPGLRIALY